MLSAPGDVLEEYGVIFSDGQGVVPAIGDGAYG